MEVIFKNLHKQGPTGCANLFTVVFCKQEGWFCLSQVWVAKIPMPTGTRWQNPTRARGG